MSQQGEREKEFQIASLAVDCFPDEILAHCKVRIYIFSEKLNKNEELTTDMWKDSLLVGLCTLHVNYMDHSPRVYVTNLLTRQVCFTAKTVLELKIQDRKWISFKFKEQDYTVGMRLLDDDEISEKFIAKFSEILLHKYRSEKEVSENRKIELQADKIKLNDTKKRFSLTSIFRKSKPTSMSPRASIVPTSELQHPEKIRISMPKTENFSHVTHIEYDKDTHQLVDVAPEWNNFSHQGPSDKQEEIPSIRPAIEETTPSESKHSPLEELTPVKEKERNTNTSKRQLPARPQKKLIRPQKQEENEFANILRERRNQIEGDVTTTTEECSTLSDTSNP